MAVRHCLMAGMCEAADELPNVVPFQGTKWRCVDCSETTSNSRQPSSAIVHTGTCPTAVIRPAQFRCPATVSASEHCEREWMEAIS